MKTNKMNFLFRQVIVLLVGVIVFSACSNEDDSSEKGSEKKNPNRIEKIITEEYGSIYERDIYETTYLYDSLGRVVKVLETEYIGKTVSFGEIVYQYGESEIITREVSGSWSESHTYTLKNGLIIKDVEVQLYNGENPSTRTTSYSYDNSGYMVSMSYSGEGIESKVLNLKWDKGNIVSLGERKYSYTDILWPKGMFFYYEGSNMDPNLWVGGFWGKTPKNMPYQNSYNGWTYKYDTSNGLISKDTIVDNETGKVIAVSTIYWSNSLTAIGDDDIIEENFDNGDSTASGDDDDISTEDFENGEVTGIKCTIKDNGKTLVMTITGKINGASASSVITCTFDGTSDDAMCIKAEQVDTYPNATIAKAAYDEEVEEFGSEGVKLSGNKVIIDLTEDLSKYNKAQVRAIMEMEKQAIESGDWDFDD